jgi:hypothetical protein
MSTPRVVVYADNRPFRLHCDALLREAGALVRLASRPAELAKALADGTTAAIIVGDDGRDADVVRALMLARPATLGPPVPIMQRAPGESIEAIVARALGVTETAADQPRSSE